MTPNCVVTQKSLTLLQPMALSVVLLGLLTGALPNAVAAATRPKTNPCLTSVVASALCQAETLSGTQKNAEALEVLRSVRAKATPTDLAYWQLYGDLAWNLELKLEAILAYRTVWEAGSSNALAMERLIQYYNANGQPQMAIAVGKKGYQQIGHVRWMLLAMDAASQASLWDELRSLSRQVQEDEANFRNSEMYWLLTAHISNHDGNKSRARTAYGNAIALNPTSVPTRVQILWFELDDGDKQQLSEHLQQWQEDAQLNPAYWTAYAVAHLRLGRVDDSLVWFNKQAREKPDDYLWQLSYISALSNSGRPDAVQRLRRDILIHLRGKLAIVDGMPKADGKVVLLAYASMAREFDGVAVGDQVLQDTLKRGYNDGDVYELLVASSLSQKNFESAHRWLTLAEADHQRLPAYQTLAVALAQNDKPAIEQLLLQREQDLSTADRVTALRRLGRDVLALSLTEKSLLKAEDESSDLLRQHRDQLRLLLARRIDVGYETRNLSDLKIARSELMANFPLDKGRATLLLAYNALRAEGSSLVPSGIRNEKDISLLAELSINDDPMRFTIGGNQRADNSLTYGRFEWTHAFTKRLNARLDMSLNGLTEETSALRVIGKKDKISVGLSSNLTDLTYARMELAGQYFKTRNDDALGHGYRLEGEIGTTVLKSLPTWQMRISGSSEKNKLVDRLPANLLGVVVPSSQTIENVLAPRFSTLGVGTTWRFGQADGVGRRPHGELDGWIGRQWPANQLAYNLRAAFSIPVSQAGQLRFETFYTNVQGGQSTKANRGVGAWYRHEF